MTFPMPPSAGVIGWPVAHSKSPLIHRFWLQKLGIDGDYGRFPVDPDRLGEAIRALPALGLRGVNVTLPHKRAVIDHLDEVTDEARAIGAVNHVIVCPDGTLLGDNSDVGGFIAPLAGSALAEREIVVIGAGGAARAVLAAVKSAGINAVTLLNRDVAKAGALLREFGLSGEALPLDAPLPPATLLVNASTLGMTGAPPLRLDLSPLPRDAIVYDIVYSPLETSLLAAARARGLTTIDGLHMLIGQAALSFGGFYHALAPRAHDAELRALLVR